MPNSTRTSAFWFCMPHSYAVRILVVNVNTTAAMTEAIAASAKSVAGPETEILPLTPDIGADSVEGNFESYLAAVAVMDAVTRYPDPFDAVVQAGFGEHGREGLQELLDVPVVDITEAAAHVACLLGHKYSVVTTLDRAVPLIEDRLKLAGLDARCASVRSSGLVRARARAGRARPPWRPSSPRPSGPCARTRPRSSAWAAAAWPGWTRRCGPAPACPWSTA